MLEFYGKLIHKIDSNRSEFEIIDNNIYYLTYTGNYVEFINYCQRNIHFPFNNIITLEKPNHQIYFTPAPGYNLAINANYELSIVKIRDNPSESEVPYSNLIGLLLHNHLGYAYSNNNNKGWVLNGHSFSDNFVEWVKYNSEITDEQKLELLLKYS